MKKLFIYAVTALCLAAPALHAQSPFSTMDSININKINELILVHGDMGWNPIEMNAHCYFPAGSPASINFVNALWMSGYDAGNNLHIAAQTYRQNGNDYWPGPEDAGDTLTYATSAKWAKIWKLNQPDIDYFRSLPTHTTATTPQVILTWPGKGNTYAEGNGGAPLAIPDALAPFVDINGNGIYEPLLGEYPAIKGDQALWYVFSDNGPRHTETNGKPLGVEIRAMVYGFHRGTLIDNVVYYDYTIVNKSVNTYHNFRLGLFDDIDMGYYFDDYIGFDSARRMGICYGGTPDDGASAGHPVNSYGTHMPIAGVTWVVLPGDGIGSYVPAGSFIYYQNDGSPIGNPAADTEYNYYLRSRDRYGQHYTNDFAGPGIPCLGHGTGPDCNYVFPGDPSNTAQWSECACNNMPGDRRFVIASNDFTLTPGGSQRIVMALIATDPDTSNGCPNAGFDKLKIVTDTAWEDYFNPPPPTLVKNIPGFNPLRIYPNPAHDKLFIENVANVPGEESIVICNTLGQKLNVPINKNGLMREADVSKLPDGLYTIIYNSAGTQTTAKFVKD